MGEYVRTQFDKYYFRDVNKNVQTVAVGNLIESDVNFLQTLVPPKMSIGVKSKKVSKEWHPDSITNESADDRLYTYTVTVTLSKMGKAPFSGTLQAELYLIGREHLAKDSDVLKLMTKKTFPVRFSATEKKPECTFSAELLAYTYTEYNARTMEEYRGQDYEGYALFILGMDGEVIEVKTDLKWLDVEEYDLLRHLRLGCWFDENCKKHTPPRPTTDTDRADW